MSTEVGTDGGLTARLGELIAGGYGPITDGWRDLGERAFVDTVAALFAGRDETSVALVAATVDADGAGGPARSVATGAALPTRSAALVDGTAAHALDYDDVDDAVIGHPSAVLVPAILALGGELDSPGERLLTAYQRGLSTARALAGELGIEGHYARGWHATSTIGTVAAAASAASLLGLPPPATRHCLGIAASMAGGSRQNFGTMTKPLHVGLAAEHGVLAARLAGRGFTADPDQLEGPMGFVALFGDPSRATATGPSSDDVPAGLNVKLHPCCYATHAAIDAAIELADELPAGAAVTAVEVVAPPGGLGPLIHHRPTDGLQAKFSMEYAVAAALLDREVTLASFAEDRVRRADVQDLLRTVTAVTADAPPVGAPRWAQLFAATVTVHTADGATTRRTDHPAGHAARPVSEAQLRAKFDDCLSSVGIAELDKPYEVLRTLRHQPSARAVLDVLASCRS